MSLGQAAFFGIGAYIAAISLKAGVPFLLVLPMAAVACFIVGLALGFPALRVQHHYLAFATLASMCWCFSSCATRRRSPAARLAFRPFLGLPLRVLDGRASCLLLPDLRVADRARVPAVVAAALAVGDAPSLRCATTRSAPRAWASTSRHTRCSPSRSAPRAPGSLASITRPLVGVHRAWSVPLLDVAADASGGDRRRLRTLLRAGGRDHHHHPAAGAAAREQHGGAQVHAEVVPRVLRRCRGGADGVAAGGILSIGTASGREAPNDTVPRSEGHEEGVWRHQGGRRRQPVGWDPARSSASSVPTAPARPPSSTASSGRSSHSRQRRVLRRRHHRDVAARALAARRGPHVPDRCRYSASFRCATT